MMNDFRFGLKITTAGPLGVMEGWLAEHCSQRYHISFDGMSDDRQRKTISIYFQNATDRLRFREHCRETMH